MPSGKNLTVRIRVVERIPSLPHPIVYYYKTQRDLYQQRSLCVLGQSDVNSRWAYRFLFVYEIVTRSRAPEVHI